MDAISNVNGIDEFMNVGQPAWHGKGQILQEAATASQAIQAAHLDWTVSKRPIVCPIIGENDETTRNIRVPDQFAVVRDDTVDSEEPVILGTVGNRFEFLQNVEAFGIMDSIVDEGEAIFHSAGALFGGSKVFISAKLPDSVHVVGDDVVDQYFIMSNAHDGSSSLVTLFAPIRPVCWNTLSMALSASSRALRIRHTKSIEKRAREGLRIMGIIRQAGANMGEVFRGMAKVDMNGEKLKNYFDELYPSPEKTREDSKRSWTIYDNRLEKLTAAFESSPSIADVPGARGTLWGAYNAITQYVDHMQNDPDEDKKTNRILFAGGSDIKIKAYQTASEIASQVA